MMIAVFPFYVASGLSVLGWTRTPLAGLALGGPARLANNYKEILSRFERQGSSQEEAEYYWNRGCQRADELDKIRCNVPARTSCDTTSEGSWVIPSSTSEASYPESAQSDSMDNRLAAAARTTATVLTEVAGPAIKVVALASANVAEGALTNGLQVSFYITASLERMFALLLSFGILFALGYYEFMISRPMRIDKAIQEAKRLLQVSRASTSFKLNSSRVNRIKNTSGMADSNNEKDQDRPSSQVNKPFYDKADRESKSDKAYCESLSTPLRTVTDYRSPACTVPQHVKKKTLFSIDQEWQPPLAPSTARCQESCQECAERARREAQEGRATPQPISTCG